MTTPKTQPATMPLKHIYLFYGADHYSAQQKARLWKEQFITKYGDLNFQSFDGEKLSANEFAESVATVPFLSEKKLIIINDFLRDAAEKEQKEVADYLEKVADYNIVVFIEHTTPDARTILFKKLSKQCQAIEFQELQGTKLNSWIKQEAEKKGLNLDPFIITQLIELIGPNLWQLSHELEKLALYAISNPLDSKIVEQIISPNFSSSIFKLTDYVGQKDSKKAISTLATLIKTGEDLFQIFYMIVRQFRILIQIKSCLSQQLDKPAIIKKVKEHPFVISTGISQCKNFSEEILKKIYFDLLQIEIDAKSGRIRTTTGDNTELRMALEKFIIKVCL